MAEQILLWTQQEQLVNIVKNSLSDSGPLSVAFALRILGTHDIPEILKAIEIDAMCKETNYGGYPHVAGLGFLLGSKHIEATEHKLSFLNGIKRLMERTEEGLKSFAADDVAILGIADGLTQIGNTEREQAVETAGRWLIKIIDQTPKMNVWSIRMRDLAGDLLDNRGRLRVVPQDSDASAIMLEITLRNNWLMQFAQVPALSEGTRKNLLKELLTTYPPTGDLDQAAVWLSSLNLLVDQACEALTPSISDVSRILISTQHAFKRWVWETTSTRRNTAPARWLIDKEAHVQSLLWAVLYPIYGTDLVDETYLPNWGNAQPRFDLGIVKLKLIIEVKYVREPRDFKKIEGEVGEDLGLYFKDTDLFDRMIVFVYDDCDKESPEKYEGLRNALIQRERIEDVIITRRPGMMPPRNERNF